MNVLKTTYLTTWIATVEQCVFYPMNTPDINVKYDSNDENDDTDDDNDNNGGDNDIGEQKRRWRLRNKWQ